MKPVDFLNQDLMTEQALIEMYSKALSKSRSPWMGTKLEELRLVKQRHVALLSEKIAEIGGRPSTDPRGYAVPEDEKKILGSIWQWEKELYLQYLEQADELEDASLEGTLLDLTDDQKQSIELLKSIIQRI